MTPSGASCRRSRVIAYSLVLASVITLCNVALSPVSSQTFDTASVTSTNTQTYFTIGYATSRLNVTVYTVQFTTSTQMLTNLIVQFTTITSSINRVQMIQPNAASAPPLHSNSAYGFHSIDVTQVPRGLTVSLAVQTGSVLAIVLASTLLIFRKNKWLSRL